MSTTWIEGNRSFFIGSQAYLIENDREMASSWATPHVRHNDAYSYILGRFVEADRANSNRQLFSLAGLQMNRPTLDHAPMNMNHSARRVVGAFVASDLIYPTEGAAVAKCAHCGEMYQDDTAETCPNCGGARDGFPKTPNEDPTLPQLTAAVSDAGLNPYIEALGVFWKHYFPEEFDLVQAAHAEGRLYYSMECVPAEIQCAGAGGCGNTYEYAGRSSDTYCDHLNQNASDKLLIDPHFTAGAVLVPPVRPGWANADIHSLVSKHAELAEEIYDGVKADLAHLDPRDWELLMGELLVISTKN